jgi:hypothetical protein
MSPAFLIYRDSRSALISLRNFARTVASMYPVRIRGVIIEVCQTDMSIRILR